MSAGPIVIGCNTYDFNDHDIRFYGIDDSPLLVEPGRPKPFPVARQRLVPESIDGAQSLRPSEHGDQRMPGVNALDGIFSALCARMGGIVDLGQMLEIQVRVDLSRGDVGVAEQFLHAAQVAGRFEYVAGE